MIASNVCFEKVSALRRIRGCGVEIEPEWNTIPRDVLFVVVILALVVKTEFCITGCMQL